MCWNGGGCGSSSCPLCILSSLGFVYENEKWTKKCARSKGDQHCWGKSCGSNYFIEKFQSWGGKYSGLTLARCCTNHSFVIDLMPICFQTRENDEIVTEQIVILLQWELSSNGNWIEFDWAVQHRAHLLGTLDIVAPEWLSARRLRLANWFQTVDGRHNCVLARMRAIAVLIYARSLDQQAETALLYTGLVDQLVQIQSCTSPSSPFSIGLTMWKLRIPSVHRNCLHRSGSRWAHLHWTNKNSSRYKQRLMSWSPMNIADSKSLSLASASTNHHHQRLHLSSFLSICGLEPGSDATISSGLVESLVAVVNQSDAPLELLNLVTRTVRILDLITTSQTQQFLVAHGMAAINNRLPVRLEIYILF